MHCQRKTQIAILPTSTALHIFKTKSDIPRL